MKAFYDLKRKRREERKLKKTKANETKPKDEIIWEFQDNAVWYKYDMATIDIVEKAYQRNKFGTISFRSPINQQTYTVYFSTMHQENVITKFRRPVRRIIESAPQEQIDDEDEDEEIDELKVKHVDNITKALSKLFNKKEFSDITFICEGKKIFGHKVVLKLRNQLIYEMVKDVQEISVDDKYDAFFPLLQYLYTGQIMITEEIIHDLMALLDKYKVEELISDCFDFIIKSLDEDSIHEIVMKGKSGEFKFATELIAKCVSVSSKKSTEIFKSESFYNLDEDIILKIFQSNDIFIDEIDLFDAMLEWGKRRCKDQENHSDLCEIVKNISQHIRYPLIDAENLILKVKPTGLISEDMYRRALEFNASPDDVDESEKTGIQYKERGKLISGSSILSPSQCNILMSWINQTKEKNKNWVLAYRGSRDGFHSTVFHRLCDNKGPTIVVVKSQSGNIFGGYNPQNWTSNSMYTSDPNTFLFSLKTNASNQPRQMKPIPGKTNHCYGSASYGPTFGGGHDLYICSNSNSTFASYSNLGHTFNLSGYVYGQQNTKSYLAGSYNFQVAELEVFVIKKK